MLNVIAEYFNKINTKYIAIENDNYQVLCLTNSDRLIFTVDISNRDIKLTLHELNVVISELLENDGFSHKLHTELDIGEEDNYKYMDDSMRMILWDLYLVLLSNDNELISTSLKTDIERNTYLSRKVILQNESKSVLLTKYLNFIDSKSIMEDLILNEVRADDRELFMNEIKTALSDKGYAYGASWDSLNDIQEFAKSNSKLKKWVIINED